MRVESREFQGFPDGRSRLSGEDSLIIVVKVVSAVIAKVVRRLVRGMQR